jgi:hypothetical protein
MTWLKKLWNKLRRKPSLDAGLGPDADTMAQAAAEMGRQAYPATRRAVQEGDYLYLSSAPSKRTPINLIDWLEGFWGNEPPPTKPLLEVVGEHDVVRIDSKTNKPIYHKWARAYVNNPALRSAELIVFPTKGAWVFSARESDDTKEKRVFACLAEAVAISRDMVPNVRPAEETVEDLTDAGRELWELLPTETKAALSQRYHDAPVLLRWPAPEWENEMARALVQCAKAGGKDLGQEYTGLPQSIAVPSWKER